MTKFEELLERYKRQDKAIADYREDKIDRAMLKLCSFRENN